MFFLNACPPYLNRFNVDLYCLRLRLNESNKYSVFIIFHIKDAKSLANLSKLVSGQTSDAIAN